METAYYSIDLIFDSLCYCDYLQDHHNREGEQLIAISLSEDMSLEDLKAQIYQDTNGCVRDELWDFLDCNGLEITSVISEAVDTQSHYLLHQIREFKTFESPEEVYLYAFYKWDVEQ